MKKLSLMFALITFAILAGTGAAASFDMQLSTDSVSSCPCTPNEVKVDVTNLYRDVDTIEFSLELPDGWSGFVQPDVMLGSGDSETIPVYITPSCDPESKTYTATLKAESIRTGNEMARAISIDILKCYFVSIDLEETYRDVCQESDEGKVFNVNIKNEGKSDEVFQLSTDTKWAVFSDSSVPISSGEEKTVQLMLDPPEDLAGVQSVILAAESASSYAKTSEEIEINIENCYGFKAKLTPAEKGETSETGTGDLPSVSIGEPEPEGDNGSDVITGMAGSEEGQYPWRSMVLAVIIIIVVLLIIYIIVKK